MPNGNVNFVPEKILLIRFSSMGDVIMTTPTIRCVRKTFPYSELHMVIREDLKDLIISNPHLDKIFTLSRDDGISGLIKLIKKLNKERYDIIYDMHFSLRSILMMPLLKSEIKLRFSKNYIRRSMALTFKFPKLKDKTRMLERFIISLQDISVTYDKLGPEIFFIESQKVRDLFKNLDSQNLIGIVPSAQWPGKRWPKENFKNLIDKILHDTEHMCVIFGGPKDHFCAELTPNSNRVLNLQGKLSLNETIHAMSFCKVVVANDTGLMHMADSLGVPVVVIMGPTSGELGCLPYHKESIVVEKKLWCRPCSKNGEAPCIRLKRRCLIDISVDEVMNALKSILMKLNSHKCT